MDISSYQADSLLSNREKTRIVDRPPIQEISGIGGANSNGSSGEGEEGSLFLDTLVDTVNPLQHIPGDEGREDAANHLQGLLRGHLQDHHQPAQTASHRGRLQGGAADPAGRQEDDQAEEEDLPRPLAALPHRSQQQPET